MRGKVFYKRDLVKIAQVKKPNSEPEKGNCVDLKGEEKVT
jgi:hypothetical protein